MINFLLFYLALSNRILDFENPQINFFKSVYHRHTNFAIENLSQKSNKSPDFGKTFTFKFPEFSEFRRPEYILKIVLPSIYLDTNQTCFIN